MFSLYVVLVILAALAACPYWRRHRPFLPLHLWAIYCGLGSASVLGVSPLRFRWVAGCAFGALGLWWLWRARRRTVDSMVALPLLLIAWALASTVYSELPDYSLLRAIALVPMYVGVFLGVRSLLWEPDGVARVTRCLLVMIGVQVALAIGAYALIPGSTFGGRFQGVHRATGTAHQLAYAVPFTLLLASRACGWRRAAWMTLTAGALYLLVLTRSRTGLLGGVLVTPVAYLVFLRGLRGARLAGALALCAVLAAGVWAALANDATLEFFRISSAEELLRTRTGRWERILTELWDSPWIGHGYGTVRYFAVGGAMTWTLEAGRSAQVHTHNEFLSLLYDLGVVPTLMLASFLAVVGWRGAALLSGPTRANQPLLIACFLSWIVDALDTITHDGLLTIGNPAATWFWIKSLLLFYGSASVTRSAAWPAGLREDATAARGSAHALA
ncbi:MAG: O-antigen ligase family protein [Planctomycetota bacterium]